MCTLGVPFVGHGPGYHVESCLTPPIFLVQSPSSQPSGCVSQLLFLNAVGVLGTRVAIPTELALLLPSVSILLLSDKCIIN